MAPLSIRSVCKEYQVRGKKVLALDSVDLSVAEGEFVTIVGPLRVRQIDIIESDRGAAPFQLRSYSFSWQCYRRHIDKDRLRHAKRQSPPLRT